MAVTIQQFLNKVAVIKATNPKYRQPGDGSDGTCDCIGLVIGAIRRCGLKWTGIHGSNWAARREAVNFRQITDASQLELGDIVLKGCAPGTSGYALPGRYRQGGQYYNGDLTDYYHAGVVTSVNPLNITHMSSKITVDKKLGKWNYAFRAKVLVKAGAYANNPTPVPGPAPEPIPTPTPAPTPSTGKKARVVAPSGRYVKMRQQPTQKCRLYDEVPVGAIVTLEKPGEGWAQISYGNRKNWYMMAKFLEVI